MALPRFVVLLVPLLVVTSPTLTIAVGPEWSPPVGMGALVGGDSMEPTICAGDLVVYEDWTTIEKGDLITFYNDRLLPPVTTHRVVAVTEHGYLTQGDNRPRSDYPIIGFVEEDQVIGEVLVVLSARRCGVRLGDRRLADRSPHDGLAFRLPQRS